MLRVMIVEDEDMIRKGLVFTIDWLSMDCVVVAEASNGQEGYERILEYKPDVVIADICMPFMDGIEMIQKASEKVKYEPVFEGRFNIGVVSLVFYEDSGKGKTENRDFYEVLDYYLELIRRIHIRTYAYLGEMKASSNPMAYCEGGF